PGGRRDQGMRSAADRLPSPNLNVGRVAERLPKPALNRGVKRAEERRSTRRLNRIVRFHVSRTEKTPGAPHSILAALAGPARWKLVGHIDRWDRDIMVVDKFPVGDLDAAIRADRLVSLTGTAPPR